MTLYMIFQTTLGIPEYQTIEHQKHLKPRLFRVFEYLQNLNGMAEDLVFAVQIPGIFVS